MLKNLITENDILALADNYICNGFSSTREPKDKYYLENLPEYECCQNLKKGIHMYNYSMHLISLNHAICVNLANKNVVRKLHKLIGSEIVQDVAGDPPGQDSDFNAQYECDSEYEKYMDRRKINNGVTEVDICKFIGHTLYKHYLNIGKYTTFKKVINFIKEELFEAKL